ncbi:MAG: hypothetical protein D6712_03730 [Chloroflexi bacterium]|nr:MAG: hypothetical protein D6712_03730 [Chloroflexota bacterium]
MKRWVLLLWLIALWIGGLWLTASGQETPPVEITPEVTPEATKEPQAYIQAIWDADLLAPLVGQPITLTLSVETEPIIEILKWPTLPSDMRYLVLDIGDVAIQEQENLRTYQQMFRMVIWSSGDFEPPDMPIEYREGGEEIYTVVPTPVFISVPSTLIGVGDTLKPVKPPIDLPVFPWLLAVVAIAALGGASWWGWRQYKERQIPPPVAEPTALEKAMEQLEELETLIEEPMAFYPALADCLRTFIENGLKIPACEMTTTELIEALTRQDIKLEAIAQLQRILEQTDIVKFAKQLPDHDSSGRILRFSRKWLEDYGRQFQKKAED